MHLWLSKTWSPDSCAKGWECNSVEKFKGYLNLIFWFMDVEGDIASVVFGFVLESLLHINNTLGIKFFSLSFGLRNNNKSILIIPWMVKHCFRGFFFFQSESRLYLTDILYRCSYTSVSRQTLIIGFLIVWILFNRLYKRQPLENGVCLQNREVDFFLKRE